MIDTTGMTLQQVSDAIAGKVIEQGGRCMSDLLASGSSYASCAYSDGSGKHCAIGWLISESSPLMKYDGSLSTMIESSEFDKEPNGEFILDNIDALIRIQILHDNPYNLVKRVELIVRDYDLNMDAWSEWIEMGAS